MLKGIKVSQFKGITFKEIDLPACGVIIEGTNAQGKTSLLEAIRVGLLNKGAASTMVRQGADKSTLEFVIEGTDETGDLQVVRRMTADGGNNLTVKDALGVKIDKPQTFLNNLLGAAPIDALALWNAADPKERKERILRVVPMQIPEADLRNWTAGDKLEDLVQTNEDGTPNLDRHGAVIIEEITKAYYDRRTIANKAAKDASKVAQEAQGALREKELAFRQRALAVGMTAAEAETLSASVLEAELTQATQVHASLLERARLAESASQQHTASLQRIEALKQKQADLLSKTWTAAHEAEENNAITAHDNARVAHEAAEQEVEKARRALALAEENERKAREVRAATQSKLQSIAKEKEDLRRNEHESRSIAERIAELQSAILGSSPAAPSADEIQQANGRVAELKAKLSLASEVASLRKVRGDFDTTKSEAFKTTQDSERLDAIVCRWQKEIPAEAFARYGGIPGLSFGDDVMLDGIPIGQLSGRERLQFCIEIARRGNERSKFIVQDGLEAVADDILPFFLSQATRGGYQLIVTRVTRGALNIISIDEYLAQNPATSSAVANALATNS